jgi:hypothetical protein
MEDYIIIVIRTQRTLSTKHYLYNHDMIVVWCEMTKEWFIGYVDILEDKLHQEAKKP